MEYFQRILIKIVGQEIPKEELEKVSGGKPALCAPGQMTTQYSTGKVFCGD